MTDKEEKQSWVLEVLEDPESDNLLLQFPEEMLKMLNWKEGDTLEWHQEHDNSWVLKKL